MSFLENFFFLVVPSLLGGMLAAFIQGSTKLAGFCGAIVFAGIFAALLPDVSGPDIVMTALGGYVVFDLILAWFDD